VRSQVALFARIFTLCFRARPVASVIILVLLLVEAGSAAVLAIAQGVLVDQSANGIGVQVVLAVLLGAAFYALTHVGWRVQNSLAYDVAEAVELDLATDVLGFTTRSATIDHLEEPGYLDRLTVLLRNSQVLAYAAWNAIQAAVALAALAVSLVVLARIDPLLLVLGLFGIPSIFLAGRAGDLYMDAIDHNGKLLRLENRLHAIGTASEPLSELLVAGSAAAVDERADGIWREMLGYEMRARRMAVILTWLGSVIYVVGVALAVGWTAELVRRGEASIGDVAIVIALSTQLQDQINFTLGLRLRVAEAGRISGHFLWLQDRAGRLPEPSRPLAGITTGLQLDDVSFAYPASDRPALEHVTLTLPAGSVLGVVGVNGAGKSTLAKLLTGLYPPTSGRVLVDGRPVGPGELSLATAGAFQDYCQFQFRAYEAVGVGDLPQVDDEHAVAAAARRGRAEDVVARLPDRWRTQLGEVFDGARLSKGEWQRLALARGLMRPAPVILVLDEPTAALDPQAEHDIFAEFAAHARRVAEINGAVTILISHRFSTVTMTDQIVVLDGGRLVEQGSHDELMSRPSRYRSLYQSQARGYAAPG
jgi:ATP-binding cassette subfamily B protein